MIALLDTNVLVALFDAAHVHHDAAHEWFATNRGSGWASCALTENGLVRIISNPTYPGRRVPLVDAVSRLKEFTSAGHHSFWPDALSVRDEAVFDFRHVAGSQQITDVSLLAIAVARAGRLTTFDTRIRISAVRNATTANLVVIGT